MRKIFLELKNNIPQTVLLMVLTIVNALGMLLVPLYMGQMISDGIVQAEGEVVQIHMSEILINGGVMLGFATLAMVSGMLATYVSAKLTTKICAKVRFKVFDKVQSFSLNEYYKFGGASLITRSTNDVTQVQNLLFMILRFGAVVPIAFGFSLYMAVSMGKEAGIVLAISVPIIILIAVFVGLWVVKRFKLMQSRLDKMTLVMRENLNGVRVIRAFNQEDAEKNRFDEVNKGVTEVGLKVGKVMASLMPIALFMINVTVLAVMVIMAGTGDMTRTGKDLVADIMPVSEYILNVLFSVMNIIMLFVIVPRASVSAKRIQEVLDVVPTISDNADADSNDTCAKTVVDSAELEFENVSYKYPGAEEYIIRDVSFSAKGGETVAFIGSTGSGKSTLLNMLPRFFDATDGEIKIGGQNIKDYPLSALRGAIGFIPQKAVLFEGTIAENIRYGKENATDEEVACAARIAEAASFIAEKEGGYLHKVEQAGANFSGGQKQRLAIARALVRKPKIYIFDDSFSALDYKTDALLRASLKKEVKDALVLIVAQRIGTVRNADKIIVMEEGRIESVGTHKELMETSAVYREIAFSQATEEELNV